MKVVRKSSGTLPLHWTHHIVSIEVGSVNIAALKMLVQEPVHVSFSTFFFFQLLQVKTKTIFKAAIWHCLNHYAYGDATFLAERLFYEVHSDESLHLLATCYYRSGKLGQAYDVLQTNGARTPSNKFLLAKCCNQLNKWAPILIVSKIVSLFAEKTNFEARRSIK